MKKSDIPGILSFLIIAFSVFYSFYSLVPHKISGKNTPLEEFSTTRAMEHIKVIAKEPHFAGTQYHREVREYLIKELNKLGLKTEVQSQFSVNEKWGGATMNHNILARIKGTGNGKAVMLLSHYDSAPFASKGASDDAVGVATILEGLRAFIKSGAKHQNDIIILFSDGEEIGLNGAKAFVEHHPLVKDVGIVINFEARGSGGPSFTLMETNGGNEMLVKALAEAKTPYPVANSFLYSVYKMLPNDTDLTVFREISDIDGFNFAFIDDFYDYHCSTDNYENIDINTVEHQGSYLMSMLDQFKNYDLNKIKSSKDYIYFNFPGLNLVYYPFSWSSTIFFAISCLFILSLIIGIKLKRLKIKNMLKAFIPTILSLIAALVISIYGWKLIIILHPSYSDILHGFPYNGHDYIAGFSFLIMGLSLFITFRYFRELTVPDFLVPVMTIWLVMSGFFTYNLTGASFFIIPAYFLYLIFISELLVKIPAYYKVVIYTIISLPALLMISPFIDMFPVGLKMKSFFISAFLLILMTYTIIPVIKQLRSEKFINMIILGLGVIFLIKAESNAGFNENRPKPNSLNYVFYADENKAVWETFNKITDPWLEKIMGSDIKKGGFTDNKLNSKFNDQVTFHSIAPLLNIPQPWIHYLLDTIIKNERVIEFEVESKRNACYMELKSAKDTEFRSFEVNGVSFNAKNLNFSKGKNSIVAYYITEKNERPRFRFCVQKTVQPELLLYEASYDLIGNPDLKVPPRPDENIAMPFVLNDLIIIVKKLNW